MNIFEKMLCVSDEIGPIVKDLTVGDGKNQYKAVGEVNVVTPIKVLEKKYGIYSYPFSRKIIDSQILTTQKIVRYDKPAREEITTSTKQFMRIEILYRFVNTEKPEEYIDIPSFGDGIDLQDKAPGKAMTYADKYALIKAYKMISGEDPDQNLSEENNWTGSKKANNKNTEPTLITKTESTACYNLMKRKGLDVVKELQMNYGIDNTEKLTKEQYSAILKIISGLPDKQ